MAGAAKAKAKGKAGAKAKPKAAAPKAKAKTAARALRRSLNSRRNARHAAVREINALAADVGATPVRRVRKATPAQIETLVRILQRRMQTPGEADRLRGPVERWVENGGQFSVDLAPAPGPEDPPLARHKVLAPGYRLKSRAFMLTYNKGVFTMDNWSAYEEFIRGLHERLGSHAWAACLEHSSEAGRMHFHAYFFWTDGVGVNFRNTDHFVFLATRPRVDVCRSGSYDSLNRRAAQHGLWYVSVMKAGTAASATNYAPWVKYTPATAWLDGLWRDHKLTHEQYLTLSAAFRTGHTKRKRDIDDVLRTEKETAVREHVARERALLAIHDPPRPIRVFPEVATLVASFEAQGKRRRPLFAIVGGTNLGKSMLARAILARIASVVGVSSFLEVTVEQDTTLDLTSFDVANHSGVLLDGVCDALFLWKHREDLQGQAKSSKASRSATMMYAVPFSLARRAVVATLDLSAANLDAFTTNHWLADARNVVKLDLDSPAWQL